MFHATMSIGCVLKTIFVANAKREAVISRFTECVRVNITDAFRISNRAGGNCPHCHLPGTMCIEHVCCLERGYRLATDWLALWHDGLHPFYDSFEVPSRDDITEQNQWLDRLYATDEAKPKDDSIEYSPFLNENCIESLFIGYDEAESSDWYRDESLQPIYLSNWLEPESPGTSEILTTDDEQHEPNAFDPETFGRSLTPIISWMEDDIEPNDSASIDIENKREANVLAQINFETNHQQKPPSVSLTKASGINTAPGGTKLDVLHVLHYQPHKRVFERQVIPSKIAKRKCEDGGAANAYTRESSIKKVALIHGHILNH